MTYLSGGEDGSEFGLKLEDLLSGCTLQLGKGPQQFIVVLTKIYEVLLQSSQLGLQKRKEARPSGRRPYIINSICGFV